MKPLNKKEETVLQAIKDYFCRNIEAPTLRKLQEEVKKIGLNFSSSRSIFVYLEKLEEKGLIEKDRQGKIKLKVFDGALFLNIPVYGSANAGYPTLVAEQYYRGIIRLSRSLFKGKEEKDLFAVEVMGNSMNKSKVNGKNIESGDYVIVDSNFKNYKGDGSEKVLAVIDGNAAVKTIKKVDGNMWGLFPDSTEKKHSPIFISKDDEFVINGRVIDVFKI